MCVIFKGKLDPGFNLEISLQFEITCGEKVTYVNDEMSHNSYNLASMTSNSLAFPDTNRGFEAA